MNTKHMPGHWEFEAQDTHHAFCGPERRPAANPDYDFRIEFSDHVPEDEVDATVHLIHAAPELYAALELAREEIWAWRKGINTRTGFNNFSKAKVGACFGGLPAINTAQARARGEVIPF